MAKCIKCGKKGFFLITKNGYCKTCQNTNSYFIKENMIHNRLSYYNNKVINDFFIATQNYETLIAEYKYECQQIGKYEKLYNIENSLIVYIGIDTWNGDGEKSIPRPHILIEELTYNDLFKFNAKRFGENFDNSFYDIRVNRFYGIKGKYNYLKIGATKFFYINEKFPNLKLLDRANSWEGVACHFIIVELYDDKSSAATIKYVTNEKLELEAQSFCRKIENFGLKYDPINKISHKKILDKVKQMKVEFVDKKRNDKKLIWTLRGHLRYFFISEKTTDFDLQSRGAQILDNYERGLYNNIEWFEYGRFNGKWKSELLVFEYCQKLYGADNVLFQYSPPFLGKMSLDVFIITKNTAIEYQGKQHFMPIDFFGGIDHYNQQIIRDKIKKKLCKQNGIKLVYINYDETITEQNIINKVNN